ncbi:DUF3301 domain-containing protein [Luteimonas pelagia]
MGTVACRAKAPHIMPVETLLALMVTGALVAAAWNAARAAHEQAVVAGRSACRSAGVQLLDDTVHAAGLRLRRRADGRMGVERSFRFEYSRDGSDRHQGRLQLLAGRLVGFTGPLAGPGRVVDPFEARRLDPPGQA